MAHIHDVHADPEYGLRGLVELGTIRCTVAVPILHEIEPLKIFEDQAVIAIENARLFEELETRNRDITQALEKQTATSQVLSVISSSPTDVQPVFEMISRSARRLCEGEFSAVFRFDGEQIHVASHDGPFGPESVEAFRQLYPMPPSRGHEEDAQEMGEERLERRHM